MESIRVVVRIRPEIVGDSSDPVAIVNGLEANGLSEGLINDYDTKGSCIAHYGQSITITNKASSRNEVNDFHYDKIFPSESTQDEIWEFSKDLVDSSLSGYNATIFAFGMTGSGKTHTIAGTSHSPGIVPRTINHVFSSLRQKSKDSRSYVSMVFLSYIELYNNNLYDLLSPDQTSGSGNLRIHDHPVNGISLTGSSTIRSPVTSIEETLSLIAKGNRHRATASTNLNERSSRSHTIITIEIVRQVISDVENDGTTMTQQLTSVGKINLVDLAGSERVKMSGAEGQALEEAKQINKALTVLGDVLNALSKYESDKLKAEREANATAALKKIVPPPHIPYRNSKLTMLLKDSLGGNSKSMMIATIRQGLPFYQQSMITLRYASRAKLIHCNPTQNIQSQDSSEAKALRLAVSEVSRLKETLNKRSEEYNEMKLRLQELEKQKHELLSDRNNEKENKKISQSAIEAKELEYRQRLEELQNKAAREQQHLQNHLRGIIHQHENILSERENDVVILELRLNEQLSHIESLSRDRHVALEDKKSIEIYNNELTKLVASLKSEIVKLKQEKIQLTADLSKSKEELTQMKRTLEQSLISDHDRETFTEALQKLSASRLKYKKKSDDLQEQYVSEIQACEELKTTTLSLQATISELQSIIVDKDQELKSLKDKMVDQNKLMQDASKAIRRLERKVLSQRSRLEANAHLQPVANLEAVPANETSNHCNVGNDVLSTSYNISNQDKEPQNNNLSDCLKDSDLIRPRNLERDSQTSDELISNLPSSINDEEKIKLINAIDKLQEKLETLTIANDQLQASMYSSKKSYEQDIKLLHEDYQTKINQIRESHKNELASVEASMKVEFKQYYEKQYHESMSKHFQESKILQDALELKVQELSQRYLALYRSSDIIVNESDLQRSIPILTSSKSSNTSPIKMTHRAIETDYTEKEVAKVLFTRASEKTNIDTSFDPQKDVDTHSDKTFESDNRDIDYFDALLDLPAPDLLSRRPDENLERNDSSTQTIAADLSTFRELDNEKEYFSAKETSDIIRGEVGETISEVSTMDITPRRENVLLKDKISQLRENDKEMLLILEKRLVELNEARTKLLKLNNYMHTQFESNEAITPQKETRLSRQIEDKILKLEQEIRQERVTSATLSAKLDQKTRVLSLHEGTIARLQSQLEEERKSRQLEIESAVKMATRFVVDNQLRRSFDLGKLESIGNTVSETVLLSSDSINDVTSSED